MKNPSISNAKKIHFLIKIKKKLNIISSCILSNDAFIFPNKSRKITIKRNSNAIKLKKK